ncbi:MAG: histone H3 methyltransferase complex and RNA cleavage factor II complex, subunit SWD2 [Monoraphidium minutum]|nr:MAG: histone H3 methyltransferase complex and RNA cleavage factor II complex, subunit SWD2 [Monoraphidium minutum]
MRLDDEVVRGMELGKAHKHFASPMNSLSFHRTRDLLVAATDDDALYVYDIESGEPARSQPVFCRKYGAQCVTWTHSADAEGSHAVRYLSLDTNQYYVYFEGHAGRVTGLDMSPKNDTFLSAGMDRTVRLWDLRTPVCQAVLTTPAPPVAAFDQQGLVFAVGTSGGVIRLYDAAQYVKGPFETFVVPELRNRSTCFSQLLFSNDGETLVAAAGGTAYVLDAFNGAVRHALRLGAPEAAAPPQVSLSYDGAYLISGCDATGAVGVWSTASGSQVAAWRGAAADAPPRCCAWAPRRLMAASGTIMLSLWAPGPSARERALAAAAP